MNRSSLDIINHYITSCAAPSYSWKTVSGGGGWSDSIRGISTSNAFDGGKYSNTEDDIPIYLWYAFPAEQVFLPGFISFQRDATNNDKKYPVDYQFIGSNDVNCGRNGNWVVLGEVKHEDVNVKDFELQPYERSYCKATLTNIIPFRCLGLLIQNTRGWEGSNTNRAGFGHVSLKEIRLWERKC